MRAREFINESKVVINEILMKDSGQDNDWKKSKYYEPFLEGMLEGTLYAFGIKEKKATKKTAAVEKQNFLGKILNPQNVYSQFTSALKTGDFKAVTFDVQVYNEDTSEPTEEVIKNLHLSNIWKDEKVTGILLVNMGNITEAILGSAVAAKFINGGAEITGSQVKEIAQQLAENKGQIQTSAGKDRLMFRVSIPFTDKKAFYAWVGKDSRQKTLKDYGLPDKTIALFDRRLKAAVEYANTSKRVLTAVEEAQQDPKENKVDVLSDGGEKENQTSTKVDLKILIDGKETAKRLLSVKAGNVAQFGQVGGHNFENINEFFSTTLGISLDENLKKYFYEVNSRGDKANKQKEHNYLNGISTAYQTVLKQLRVKSANDEGGLVRDVYKGLMTHLTRNEPGVEMVILDPSGKKAFSELSFGPEFKKALDQLKIYAVATGGEKGVGIAIYGFPTGVVAKRYIPTEKDADSKLIELRSQLTKSFNVRNRVGMGNLLKHIADIENQIEKQEANPVRQTPKKVVQKPAQNPVAKPVPQLKTSMTKTVPIASKGTKPLSNIGQPMGQESPALAPK
jgi:hypothetical protein